MKGERGSPRPPKVFGVGLSRTGTTSLTQALGILGLRVIHYPNLNELYSLLGDYDGATDTPVICCYQRLAELYPDARFVLTTRDKASWLASVERFFRARPASGLSEWQVAVREQVYGTPDWDERAFSAAYDAHIRGVTHYFADAPQRLLTFDIVGGSGWSELCSFLGRPVPEVPFPHLEGGELKQKKGGARGRDLNGEPEDPARLHAAATAIALAAQTGSVMCPVCRRSAARFEPFGTPGTWTARNNALCSACGSLERHRLAWLYLVNETDLFDGYQGKAVLHLSPDRVIYHKLREEQEPSVLRADVGYPTPREAPTGATLEYQDETFDVIYCSQVLDRAPDDRLAIRELHRVLRPGGRLLVQVAVYRDQTEELTDVPKPSGFPTAHVRVYGRDLAQRLADGAFEVKVDDFARRLGPRKAGRYGVLSQPPIFYCVRR